MKSDDSPGTTTAPRVMPEVLLAETDSARLTSLHGLINLQENVKLSVREYNVLHAA